MDLIKQFRENIQKENLFHPKDKLLLAVSGGVDSVVLCDLCKKSGYDFSIAHCNFKLRGAESERDQQFVKELSEKLAVDFYVQEFDTEKYASEHKTSIQVAARELRYHWFNEILNDKESGLKFILTAHHLDDNIETLLMNFFKGTGIAGLRGIFPKKNRLVRPLLFAKKEALVEYAKEHNLNWIEDSSNELDKYSRNYFRHQVIPLVQQVYPEADSNLSDNIQRFREIEVLYQQSIAQHKKKLLEFKGNEVHIPVLKLKKTEPLKTVLYEIIKDYGFKANQTDEVIGLLDRETGRYIKSASHRIIKNRNWLVVAELDTKESDIIVVEKNNREIRFANGVLEFEMSNATGFDIPDNSHVAAFDADKINYPLILRKWKAGDYFYPLGMKKKKKLSRFFIDRKLSKTEKEKAWVLVMDKMIIWVVGMRIDDRFKVNPSTRNILSASVKAV